MAKKPPSKTETTTKSSKVVPGRKATGSKIQSSPNSPRIKAEKSQSAPLSAVSAKAPSTGMTPPKRKDLSTPVAETKREAPTNPPETPSVLDYQEQRARIARRAYELYEERCPPDADVRDWLRAEREIMKKP